MSSSIANISLYIPHVFANIGKNMIADTFEDLRIGNVKRVDLINKRGSTGDFNAVYIHFNHWYDNISARNFQERVLDPNMEARIVYDEPWHWIVLENKTKKVDSIKRKPCVNLDVLNQLMTPPPRKMMNNQDFADLIGAPKKVKLIAAKNDETEYLEICRKIKFEEPIFVTLDEVVEENIKVKAQLGEYMERFGRLEHQYNMLMDENITLQNHNAILQERIECPV
jgi:hypothetical protein